MKFTIRSNNILGYLLVFLLFIILAISLGLSPNDFSNLNFNLITLLTDLSISYIRVSLLAIIAWLLGIIAGYLLDHFKFIDQFFLPTVNFVRHISPFAWLPFAIIWFGLGELPLAFILFVSLFFPVVIAVKGFFAEIPRDYLDEALVNGANRRQMLRLVELPLISTELINLFRIIWGLGWSIIIAAEMLGVNSGIGFRLLDLRYLLKYPQMVIYIFVMGAAGILNDIMLRFLHRKIEKKYT